MKAEEFLREDPSSINWELIGKEYPLLEQTIIEVMEDYAKKAFDEALSIDLTDGSKEYLWERFLIKQ